MIIVFKGEMEDPVIFQVYRAPRVSHLENMEYITFSLSEGSYSATVH